MSYPLQLQTFTIGEQTITLYVPPISSVQQAFEQAQKNNRPAPFPYWAQVWPAALAMGEFIHQHPHYICNKLVLELAAGLGLPSLLSARFAHTVTCTDYIEEAVQAAQQSAQMNGLKNMHCRTLDWHRLPDDLAADVLLLSDVNYDPSQFRLLYSIIEKFVESGTTVIISTPQRLMAKSFIQQLLLWCIMQQQIDVTQQGEIIPISILVLKGK